MDVQMQNDKQPSLTYKLLYNKIIEDLLFQICNSNINYCVRYQKGEDEIHIAIWKKYSEYKRRALAGMSGGRLDRHKLASCICGAIIEVKPLTGLNGAAIVKNANEIFALHVGLAVIKFYMMYDYAHRADRQVDPKAVYYIKEHFVMRFPENICDTKQYEKNMYNALYRSHYICDIKKGECFPYDIWAYAKIFYHLELYNQPYIEEAFKNYQEKSCK